MQMIMVTAKVNGTEFLLSQISFDAQLKCYRQCVQKIHNLLKKIFYWLCNPALFAFFPTIYAIGFVAGIVANKHMNTAVERIIKIWNETSSENLLIIGVGALLSLPIILATTAWAFGTQLSCKLISKIKKTPIFTSPSQIV